MTLHTLMSGTLLAAACGLAGASVPAGADPAELGRSLTPLGAERAGNADGSIPAWQGEQAFDAAARQATADEIRRLWEQDPDSYEALHLPDPGERLFEITADNAQAYADRLTPGHQALLARFDSYRMPVYPGRRIAFAPQAVYAATRRNAGRTRLIGTDELQGARQGVPFPLPRSGAEVIWNHRLRYRGDTGRVTTTNLVVGGFLGLIRVQAQTEALFHYGNIDNPPAADSTLIFQMHRKILSPARAKGTELVLHDHFTTAGRQVWMRRPGSGQVKRMPALGYDAPNRPSGGQIFVDQSDMFNGPLDRFHWQLIDKREMYVPANAARLASPRTVYEQVIDENYLNPDLARYELRRVWVVEARLREGASHAFSRRRFYVDEDSWTIVAAENYNQQGELWRVQEAHVVTFPYAAVNWMTPAVYYDLHRKGRYVVENLFAQEGPIDFGVRLPASHFTADSLKAAAEEDDKPSFWRRLLGS